MEFLDRRVVVPEAKFRAAQIQMPRAYERIAGTEPHRLLCIGFGLREATQVRFRPTSRRIQTGGIWVEREPGIGSADRLIPAVGAVQVPAFHRIRQLVIGRERDGPVGLADYFRLVVCLGVFPSAEVFGPIGRSLARQCVGFVRVVLERLIEQGARRDVFVVVLVHPTLREQLRHQDPAAHGEIDRVGVFGTGAFSASALTSSLPKLLTNRATT